MAELFRKAALDKISSPDQLDRQIRLVSPSFWIAVLGGGLILAVALIWSVFGRLPVNISAGGMYMGGEGIYNAVAEANGVVEEVFISEGEDVTKGQKLVQLDDGIYSDQISDLEQRIDIVQSVTFYSYDDTANADTKALIDIKTQADVADTSLTADQIALKERYKALSKQRKAKAKAKSDRDSAKKTVDQLNTKYANYHYEDKMNSAAAAYNAAQTARVNYENTHPGYDPGDPEYKALVKAEADALKAKQDLETDFQTLQIKIKNAESAFSIAQQTYNSEKATLKSLEDAVSQMEAKVRADKSGTGEQKSALEKQFDSAKGSVLDQMEQELRKMRKDADSMLFTARMDGKVTNVNVSEGDAVQSGMTLFKLVASKDGRSDIICYVPVSEGRKVREGMKAAVYPSTVNRQEYGHMDGSVTSVSDSTISAEDLLNELGDQALVQAFQRAGSVVRVTMKLESDPDTASGFKWSSKKGAEVTLKEGTVVSADIVIEEKAPITMLIPYLKEKLSVRRDADNSAMQQSADDQ